MLPIPPPPPAVIAPPAGPYAPTLKGVPGARSFSVARATARAMREMAGAVVVVEDDAAILGPGQPPLLRSPKLNLGLFDFSVRLSPVTNPHGQLWVDSSAVLSPGGPLQKMYPIGWGY